MCLGIPGRVVSIVEQVVTLDVMGEVRTARLDLVDEPVVVGDYVLQNLGFVTGVVPLDEALATLELFGTIAASLQGSVP